MKLILPQENPDLDGVASSYAYSEYLKSKDEKAVSGVFGDLNEQTQEVLEELDEDISDAKYYIYSADEIQLVGASSTDDISSRVPQDNVSIIIDHENVSLEDFTEAETEINKEVATASAIIAAKFFESDDEELEISNESATLLYEAITSADTVTDRDQELADWLKEQLS